MPGPWVSPAGTGKGQGESLPRPLGPSCPPRSLGASGARGCGPAPHPAAPGPPAPQHPQRVEEAAASPLLPLSRQDPEAGDKGGWLFLRGRGPGPSAQRVRAGRQTDSECRPSLWGPARGPPVPRESHLARGVVPDSKVGEAEWPGGQVRAVGMEGGVHGGTTLHLPATDTMLRPPAGGTFSVPRAGAGRALRTGHQASDSHPEVSRAGLGTSPRGPPGVGVRPVPAQGPGQGSHTPRARHTQRQVFPQPPRLAHVFPSKVTPASLEALPFTACPPNCVASCLWGPELDSRGPEPAAATTAKENVPKTGHRVLGDGVFLMSPPCGLHFPKPHV